MKRNLIWILIALIMFGLGMTSVSPAAGDERIGGAIIEKEGSWKTYRYLDGLIGNLVHAVMQDREGVLWLGIWHGGVSRFDGKDWKTYTTEDGLVHNDIHAIIQDREGALWFGTAGGVGRFDGKDWISYRVENGLADNLVRAIIQDREGAIWFGTEGGVSHFDGKSWKTYTVEDRLAHNNVLAIIQDREGSMWFGTLGGGVSKFDGTNWKTYTVEDGLAHNNVRAILQDREGAMWFGAFDGISRFDSVSWMTYTREGKLAENDIREVIQDREGALWFGTDGGGVSKFDGKDWKTYTVEDGLAYNGVGAIMQDREGALWFGTYGGGVSRFDGRDWKTYTVEDGLAYNGVGAIMQDREGALWFGTYGGGVSRFDGRDWKTYTVEDGLAHNDVRAIIQDIEGALWFGTDGGGVSKFDGKEWKTYTVADELAGNYVWAIIQDREGILWFGTDGGGVSRFDGKEWKTYTVEDGLAHNLVHDIVQDDQGKMWFATGGGGVSMFDGRCFQNIDSRDGLARDSVLCAHMDESNGLIWFGTSLGGINRFIPNDVPPIVHVTQVFADEKTYQKPDEPLRLHPGVKRVALSFHASSFKTRPGGMKYFYQLMGRDTDWQGPTNVETMEYFNLKPGDYTFKIQAVDRDLNYSDPAGVEFTIPSPPFYTRAGFIIGAILVAFLIPASAFAAVVIRQRRQEFQIIPNPYIVGNPIRTKDMFFGREDDFGYVQSRLGTGEAGLVIVFAGERRSGKTSILFQILDGRLGEQFVPVLLDMQGMAVDSDAQFLERMASVIDEALVRAGMESAAVSTDSWEVDPIRTFERFIAQAMVALGDRSLLLMLDEYELIETKIDDGTIRSDLITFFASLLEAHPRLSFIFTGSRHLEQRNVAYWRVLIGKSLYRRISFLSEGDALRLIMEPVTDQVVYPRGIPERIVRLTAGQPFYTQVICQNMMDRLNEVERNRVRQEDVDAVAEELADNPLPQMIYFWDGLESDQQTILSFLGEVLEDPNRYASAQMLIDFAQEQNLALRLESSGLERVLNDLFVNEVLERERAGEGQYEYRFRVDLFRLWVRQAHSVWE